MRQPGTPTSIPLTERDKKLLSFVQLFRWISVENAAGLVFGSKKIAHRRLSKLVHAGQLRATPIPGPVHFGNQRLAYCLASAEATDGSSHGKQPGVRKARQEVPSAHHISVVDVLVAFYRHAASTRGRISVDLIPEWSVAEVGGARFRHPLEIVVPNPRRASTKLAIKPDGAIALANREGRMSLFFLELDRGTEPLAFTVGRESIRMKLEAYESMYQSGAYSHLSGTFGFAFLGFRVLFVCTTEQRVDAILRLAGEVGSSRVLGAQLDLLVARGPLGSVWCGADSKGKPTLSITTQVVPPLGSS